MAQITIGFDHVTQPRFQLFRIRKAAVALALPDQVTVHPDFKNTHPVPPHQSDAAPICRKGLQQFLCPHTRAQPANTPSAARSVH